MAGNLNASFFPHIHEKSCIFLGGAPDPGGLQRSANITGDTPKKPQTAKDRFGACLTEKGAIFYGTEWCLHCKKQKELFGDSMAFVDYIDCDKNTAACTSAGITGYPTWKFSGKTLTGTQPLTSLADATGCPLDDTAIPTPSGA